MARSTRNYKKTPEKFKEFHCSIIRKREFCTNQCPYFYVCPFAEYHDLMDKTRPCKVVNMKPEEQQQFISIFVFGEEGLKAEALRMLYRMAKTLDLKGDAREMKMYLEAVTTVARTFKKPPKIKDDPKEIPTIDVNVSTLKLDKKEKKDPLIPPNPDEFLLDDKQSLYNSSKLDGIMAHPKRRNILKSENGHS